LRCVYCYTGVDYYPKEGNFEITVEGESAEDVSKVARDLLESRAKNAGIAITTNTIGMLNLGELRNIGSISVNVATLSESGEMDISEALGRLTEAVSACSEISVKRGELLDLLQLLSEQAILPMEQRRSGVAKALVNALAQGLAAASSLATVWSTCGPSVLRFFGL
jgi:hypothetical protein